KKLNSKYKKFLEGRDIERYGINFDNKYLLYERAKLHRPRTPEIFEAKEKILVQRISGGRRPLKAAYDNEQYYDKESINNIILSNPTISAKYILALLNSHLINWYYATKFTNASELTVNVSKAYLSELPIKELSLREQEPVVQLVDRMIQLKKQLSMLTGKHSDKARELIQEIGRTDSEIDTLVYDIYGITAAERKNIED